MILLYIYLLTYVMFVKQVNGLIAISSIISSLILYKKTKDSIVFTLLLVYVGFAIASFTGQLDYYTFLNNEFRVSNYLSITTSFLYNYSSPLPTPERTKPLL